MFSRIESLLVRWARWPVISSLAAASLVIMLVLFPRLAPAESPQLTILDLQLRYSAADVAAHMEALGPEGRQRAAITHLTADMLFPLTYGTLFALLLLKAWPGARLWRLALANVGADVLENLLLALLYWTYPRLLPSLVSAASFVTTLKWGLVAVTLLYLIRGGFERWTERALQRLEN